MLKVYPVSPGGMPVPPPGAGRPSGQAAVAMIFPGAFLWRTIAQSERFFEPPARRGPAGHPGPAPMLTSVMTMAKK